MTDRADAERQIATVWAEVLRRPAIGRDDDFFALGGNSLLAVRMIALVKERLGGAAPVQKLLKCRTVAELAEALAGGEAAEEEGVI